jgi:hypothetical protein
MFGFDKFTIPVPDPGVEKVTIDSLASTKCRVRASTFAWTPSRVRSATLILTYSM